MPRGSRSNRTCRCSNRCSTRSSVTTSPRFTGTWRATRWQPRRACRHWWGLRPSRIPRRPLRPHRSLPLLPNSDSSGRPADQRRAGNRSFGRDLADLRASQGSVAHQPLFTKYESEDGLAERLRVVGPAGARLHNRHRGVRAGRPVAAAEELVERLLRLEQNHLTVLRHTERQADRGTGNRVVPDGLPLLQQRSIAVLTGNADAALRDARKYQDSGGTVREGLVLVRERVELLQRSGDLGIDGGGVHCQCNTADQGDEGGNGYRRDA